MKILVVAALPNELKAIKEGIKSVGLKANLDIDYLCCGIGNYETISSLEHYLTENNESIFIWNIGICGYWNLSNEEKVEPVQVANVVNVHNGKEMIIPPFLQLASFKTCFSSENVILNTERFQKESGTIDNEMYFDMESRGIEFIASKYKYPCLILKVPFDFIGKNDGVNKGNYKENLGKISALLISLPYYDYLDRILKWMNQ